MRTSYVVSLMATAAALTTAQKMVPTAGSSTFPACAVNCAVLLQGQSTCTPPNAITSTQLKYDDCFCKMPTLVDLYTTGETLCTAQCTTTADRQLLSTWFVTFCKQVGSGIDPIGGTGSTPTTSTTSTSSSQTAESTSVQLASTSTGSDGPWIKTHWQYILMLVFLFFGLLGIGLGARWWKKRHDQKMDQEKAAMSDYPAADGKGLEKGNFLTPGTWGSHQSTAASRDYQHGQNGALSKINGDLDSGRISKDELKRISRIQVTEVQTAPPPVHQKDSKFSPS